jgi:hypothetical protein
LLINIAQRDDRDQENSNCLLINIAQRDDQDQENSNQDVQLVV